MNRVLISLGSNTHAEVHIPRALESLHSALTIERETAAIQTEPVDYPYPSGLFTNLLILAYTPMSQADLITLLHNIEQEARRDRKHPEIVTLDLDLIQWNDEVLKPRDTLRPYFKTLAQQLLD